MPGKPGDIFTGKIGGRRILRPDPTGGHLRPYPDDGNWVVKIVKAVATVLLKMFRK
jgi:hypothetical protein